MDQEIQRIPLPRWACHKVVEAAKILDVVFKSGASNEARLTLFVDDKEVEIDVGSEYMTKHEARAGGYYVRYADGYESYSPSAAFENGYTRIAETHVETKA